MATTQFGVLVIGDEILSGKVRDVNTEHIIELMCDLGVELRRIVTMGDEEDEIAAEVRFCSERFDAIITSGGVSVGEPPEKMRQAVEWTAPLLPADRPRYLMGVGTPEDIVDMVIRHGVRAVSYSRSPGAEMIGKLKGVVDSYGPDWVIIDVHGVGYVVHCSTPTLQSLPAAGEAASAARATGPRSAAAFSEPVAAELTAVLGDQVQAEGLQVGERRRSADHACEQAPVLVAQVIRIETLARR